MCRNQQAQEIEMNHHFVQQQTNERIGSMMREADEHRLANQNVEPGRPRKLAILGSPRTAAWRLVHFLTSMRIPRMSVEEPRQSR